MPYLHINICNNPIACPNADKKMQKFWGKRRRNGEAKYFMMSSLKNCKNSGVFGKYSMI